LAKGRYWLDTNVFIDAKSGLYGFDLVPKFWKWLEDQMKAAKICSSQMIYDEICSLESPQDELYKWTKQRRRSGYWIAPGKEVQAEYTKISSYVQTTYGSANPARTANFLAKADVWIIAHALVDKGTVVTEELPVGDSVLVPKIPNVCRRFNVPFINTTGLLRTLKFRAE
jgi:Domain of unknown function (DUF4411)